MVKTTVPEHIETRLFINGQFVESSDKQTFPIKSPYSLEKIADVSEASVDDTNSAVAAAKAAFPSWSKLSPSDRGKYFRHLANLIREAQSELAYLEAVSMGRPISQYIDGFVAADTWETYSTRGWENQGTSSLNTPGFVSMTFRQPFGVAAAIIPWNAPLIFFSSKAAAALMAGNTVVVKSSEKAPLTSAKLATMIQKAGFPPGVLNVLSGHGHISGAALSSHMDVRALSFTGSGRTGRTIQVAAAQSNLKKVILELGGKSPAIIFEDANLDEATSETQNSVQWNSGQVCMANSRIYVQETIAQSFLKGFRKKFTAVSAGDPLSPTTNHGPQADETQFKTVMKYVNEGGSKVFSERVPNQGFLIAPTIFTETPESARIMKEEIFGPVVMINTFKTEDEVIQKANDTEYGLYASVYTQDVDRAMRLAKALESGYVAVNAASPTTAKDMPFGGYKASGQDREGFHHTMNNFLETKTVMIKVRAQPNSIPA